MSWTLVEELTLKGGDSILLPATITAPFLVIEASTSEDPGKERVPGYVRALAVFSSDEAPFESVDFDRVSVSLNHPQWFEVSQQVVTAYRLEIVIYSFIEFSIDLKVWAIEGETLPLGGAGGGSAGGSGHSSENGALTGELIDFLPMPSSAGIAIAPGLAVFTAGETTFTLPSSEQPDYHQQYSVSGDAFWGIGARSLDSYPEGRFSFTGGTGRSMLGFAAQLPEVDFKILDWAWYVHSPSQVYAFERPPGQSIRAMGGHSWSPAQPLSLEIVEGRVRYGIGDTVVYESSLPVVNPVYFAAVLGPQAFVVNCLRE